MHLSAGLVELRLDDNGVAADATQLADTLAQCQPMLQTLSLRTNSLQDASAATFAQLLLPSSVCKIVQVDLAGNPSIAAHTCQKLAQAMAYNSSLKKLSLARSCLGTPLDLKAATVAW